MLMRTCLLILCLQIVEREVMRKYFRTSKQCFLHSHVASNGEEYRVFSLISSHMYEAADSLGEQVVRTIWGSHFEVFADFDFHQIDFQKVFDIGGGENLTVTVEDLSENVEELWEAAYL